MPRAPECTDYEREIAERYVAAYTAYMAADPFHHEEFTAAEWELDLASRSLAPFAVGVILGEKAATAGREAADAAHAAAKVRFEAWRAAREVERLAMIERMDRDQLDRAVLAAARQAMEEATA